MNSFRTHIKGHNQKYNTEDYGIFHQEIGLQIPQIRLRLKTFEALWLQLFMTAQLQTTTALKRGLRKSMRSISLTTVQNLIGSMPTRCLEVPLSSRYCAIFGCCNITEYLNVAQQLSV